MFQPKIMILEYNLHILDNIAMAWSLCLASGTSLLSVSNSPNPCFPLVVPIPETFFSEIFRFLSNCWVWVDQKSSVTFIIRISLPCLSITILRNAEFLLLNWGVSMTPRKSQQKGLKMDPGLKMGCKGLNIVFWPQSFRIAVVPLSLLTAKIHNMVFDRLP